jgi:hopene-associated glycosyltransferase HpnB
VNAAKSLFCTREALGFLCGRLRAMLVLAGIAIAGLFAWVYLLVFHGFFWRTDQRLPTAVDPPTWPEVVAIVPARNEAAVLPSTLPKLLEQDYPGSFRVVLVDDVSSDGTASVALALDPHGVRLIVVHGTGPPPGWVGKVWAIAQGLASAEDPTYLLFCDADVAFDQESLTALVRVAEDRRLDLVSQMATLHVASFWERAIVPGFVYFFAQLYPFRWVNRASSRTAAAAGGCMLVRTKALQYAGGLERIRGALIDDVSLARLLKMRPGSPGVWLGHGGTGIASIRPHRHLADLWGMVARSAYTQLRHSPLLLAGTFVGLLLLYAGPPVAAVAGLANIDAPAGKLAAPFGLAAYLLMATTYVPTLRLYRLGALRAFALPLVAILYAGMTVDSALRHHAGRGGSWKGRTSSAVDFRTPKR